MSKRKHNICPIGVTKDGRTRSRQQKEYLRYNLKKPPGIK
jgi:hypothetical protein